MKQHVIVYLPNGSVVVKENICDYQACLVGELTERKFEKGKVVIAREEGDSDRSYIKQARK